MILVFISLLQVTYGDFTEEAGTMTTFLCPELTMRQLRRPPAERNVPENVGRVVPALNVLPDGRLGYQGPHLAGDYRLHEGGGTMWKQPTLLPSTKQTSGTWPMCETAQVGRGASWTTNAAHQHQQPTLLCNPRNSKPDADEAHGRTFAWDKNFMTLPLIA